MALDSEKKQLEQRLLTLLSQALQDRNRDDIVGTSMELGALYLSGDLYDKSEECYRRVLEEPVVQLARVEEKASAECGLARLALRRGHLTLARESLERAEKILTSHKQSPVLLEVRRLQCQREIHTASYRDVVDAIEGTLSRENPEKLGDLRVTFMVLEGRARGLMGRNRQAKRLLEKALEIAEDTGYEMGAALAHSELGFLCGVVGELKSAHEHLTEALRSDEGMGSQFRLDLDQLRCGAVLLRMGRWQDSEEKMQAAYESSRDLRTLDNRLGSQLVKAELSLLRGDVDDAHDLALDVMEVARAAGFVRRHVDGLLLLGRICVENEQFKEALEFLSEAEALYARVAPESSTMLQVHSVVGMAHGGLGETEAAFDRLMRAHNLARETGNDYELQRVDLYLARHFQRKGVVAKSEELLTRAASALGSMGAKYDVGVARLWYAELLTDNLPVKEEREDKLRLARSNVFEARRLLEPLGAKRRVEEIEAVEARLESETPASSE